MISFAGNEMRPALEAMWSACFGDSDEYINFYFSKRFSPKETLVYAINGEPAAMLTLMPAELMRGGTYIPVRYIYAVATLPKYRGKGISSKLLSHAQGMLASEGVTETVLAPAGEGLFSFYAKRGYSIAFGAEEHEFDAESTDAGEIIITTVTPREYKALRDACFESEGYLRWGEKAISYALDENAFTGGFACKMLCGGESLAVLGRASGGTLYVKEATAPYSVQLKNTLSHLALKNACTRVKLCSAVRGGAAEKIKKVGMASAAPICEYGYMNLFLD